MGQQTLQRSGQRAGRLPGAGSTSAERGVTTARKATGRVQGLSGPSRLPALLRLLEVDHEPATRQREAITTWLADNAPSQELLVSLFANGYGLMLNLHSSRRSA
jgi:hypothetical protein